MSEQNEKRQATILIVDDLSINVSILENIVQSMGYDPLCALDVDCALKLMNETMPQLILSDYYMPEVDGLEFCRMLKANPKTRDIPFLFITVADSNEEKRLAFEAGAVDYIPKPFEPVEVIMRINNQLNNYFAKQQIEENNRMMHQVIAQQRRGMEKEQENLLIALTKIIGLRDEGMEQHLIRVGQNSRVLAQSLQLSPKYESEISDEFVDIIGTAARLHDIGMLAAVADEREDEETYVRMHTELGESLLERISADTERTRALDMACLIAKYHHAHWDGSGYPAVGATEIPLAARIVSVVNDYDAMLRQSEHPLAPEEAKKAISDKSGILYEPFIVDVFQKITKQLKMP